MTREFGQIDSVKCGKLPKYARACADGVLTPLTVGGSWPHPPLGGHHILGSPPFRYVSRPHPHITPFTPPYSLCTGISGILGGGSLRRYMSHIRYCLFTPAVSLSLPLSQVVHPPFFHFRCGTLPVLPPQIWRSISPVSGGVGEVRNRGGGPP